MERLPRILWLVVGCVMGSDLRSARAEADLLFYDPDANHQSLVAITSSFNRFLDT
jgi:hypothetical protein